MELFWSFLVAHKTTIEKNGGGIIIFGQSMNLL
jgi:hypothetical protein